MMNATPSDGAKLLKLDVMGRWIEVEWMPRYPDHNLLTLLIPDACIVEDVIDRFEPTFELEGGYRFMGSEPIACSAVTRVNSYDERGTLSTRTGAFIYRFAASADGKMVEALVMGSYYADDGWHTVALGCIPRAFMPAWTAFSNECTRLAGALRPRNEVIVVGGRENSFVPTTQWDEVILPAKLKSDIMEDVEAFFSKGIDVYKRLNLKPFRKLLLAGVPGTGKTMICSAVAKWALSKNYLVIYISSAQKGQRDQYGSTFGKIQYALSVAAYSAHPTLILLEELDAYLHDEEKALVLNVLDGSEASMNDKGTLLMATTNYPEAIDERVLKRPGRLDRIFIVPEIRAQADAEQMLRQYLGAMWRDEHKAIVPGLVGFPGAFIREVAIYALTQLAYDDLEELSLELLEKSYKGLKAQIEARDTFLTEREREFGFGRTNGTHPLHS